MSISWRPALAIVLGVLLALAGAHATFLGAWTLIPWGIVAAGFGWRATLSRAAVAGATYGFAMAMTFMTAVYTGSAPVTSKLAGFFVLGCVGAVCGGVLAVAASWVSRRTRPAN